MKELLHRWIPSQTIRRDLDAFIARVTKMPSARPRDPRLTRGKPIVEVSGCWIFRGSPSHEYPLFRVPSTGSWETAYLWVHERLHGLPWEGDPPSDVDHVCENKRCVNPDHLERVPHPENVRRSRRKTQEIGEKAIHENAHSAADPSPRESDRQGGD